uniref:Uncharacterized protein n=1 Tax=Anguilla anguilla TaxID=7936 RepID=A0A0E9SX65_ANGAN
MMFQTVDFGKPKIWAMSMPFSSYFSAHNRYTNKCEDRTAFQKMGKVFLCSTLYSFYFLYCKQEEKGMDSGF